MQFTTFRLKEKSHVITSTEKEKSMWNSTWLASAFYAEKRPGCNVAPTQQEPRSTPRRKQ